MASSVATPLEKQFSTIPGVETMTSTSTQGSTQISLQFALSRNIDAAAQDVQAAISQAQRQLPRDVLPPSFRKVDPSSSPILYYALRTTTLPLPQLNEYAETFLAQRLSTVDGVAQVQVFGSMKYAVRIQIDPQELTARNIGIDEVSTAIENGNVNLPTGILWGTDKAYSVESQGQLNNAADFGALVVTYRDGAPVRLRDLGRVIDSIQDTKRASWFNGQRAVVLAVQRQPGTNTVAVAERVKAEVERLRPQIPPAIDIATLNDRSLTVKASVERREVHPLPRALSRGDGDLPLPPKSAGDHDPQPGAAHVAGGDVRGDVPAGLQPGQSLAHGAHAGGGVRGRRRHRGAGEHRPAHRAGRAGHAGGHPGQPGDQLYRALDDPVPRGGIHSGALPGRADRPAVPGVRRHHRCGHSGVGRRLADAHADALQPLAPAA